MKVDYADFVRTSHEVHLAYEKEMLNFYQHSKTKKDPIMETIAKYIYVATQNDKLVTVTEITNYFSESENNLRKKINTLVKMQMLKKIRLPVDHRVYILQPTDTLIRLYEIQATRVLKTILETSPVMKSFLQNWSDGFANAYNTSHIPSYSEGYNAKFYKFIGDQLTDKRLVNLEETKNTSKKIG